MTLKSTIKKTLDGSICGGSLLAGVNDARSLLFNMKASLFHFVNYIRLMKNKEVKRLHFGCGNDYKVGYLNIDFNPPADVYLDARNRLPFGTNSIEQIYSSHFIEHLNNEELMLHLKESYRVLKPLGCYRICVPDFAKTVAAYTNKDQSFLIFIKSIVILKGNGLPPSYLSYGDYVDKSLHEDGKHKVFLDRERLRNMLCYAGFNGETIFVSEFDPIIDNESRRTASIYLSAQKI